MTRAYDVVVVGAGPAGVAAAAAFAKRGADVLLLEAEPNAATRLAGEWLHPLAADELARLGLLSELPGAARAAGRGFAFFSDDGTAPVLLPYAARERALAIEHSVLLSTLRQAIARTPRVTYVPHARVRSVAPGTVGYRVDGAAHEVHAGLVVGADGRNSAVRSSCYGPRNAPPAVSHMAGLLVADAALPHEDYGHVLLGGPGPLLMYRVSERHVRLCLDVPVGSAVRSPEALFHAFAPVLPHAMRGPFRDALEHDRVLWAANRLAARSHYGAPGVALVGDAVGTTHPLTAAGMTLGVLDALTLAECGDVHAYARRRARMSHVPEVLSRALYEVVTREDESASAVRAAMVETWRAEPRERARTMRILAGQEQGRVVFAAAFTKVAARALRAESLAATPLRERAGRVYQLHEWARYPLSMLRGAAPVPRGEGAPQVAESAPGVARLVAHGQSGTPPERTLEALAHGVTRLVASGLWSRTPEVRRALTALLAELDLVAELGAQSALPRDARTRTLTRVLSALLDARCHDPKALERVARQLTAAFPYGTSVAYEAETALRRYAARVAETPRVQRPALRTAPDGTLSGADWDFCQASLEGVSRSFAQPIAALPPTLRAAVTVGYLLCRVADTIEDAPEGGGGDTPVNAATRDAHFDRFVAALEGRARATDFERALRAWPGTEAELALAGGLSRVLRTLDATPTVMGATVRRWVGEMVSGMRVYTHRCAGHDGLRAPLTVSDLERYCYFVAGTVGHMLTDLFLAHMGPEAAQLEGPLRRRAESFGTGLQLVNILKDVTDDRARGWAFVPRELTDLDQLSLAALLDGQRRAQAHRSIAPLFDLARKKLDDALAYTLVIPAEQTGIRLFCLLPVFMAARTLVLARDNDDVFTPGQPVKIARGEVEQLGAQCFALVGDDAGLRDAYASLWLAPLPHRPTPTLTRGDHV